MARRLRIATRLVLLLAAAWALHPLDALAQPAGRTGGGLITGVVKLFGCLAPADAFAVRATPLDPAPGSGGSPGGSRAATTLPAVQFPAAQALLGPFEPTGDPHVFLFQIAGARVGTLYRLTIDRPADACGGRIFWDGPLGGLVGASEQVEIVGLVPRASLEVLRGRLVAFGKWVGADNLSLVTGNLVRRFRYSTDLPGITGGRLQIAIRRFAAGPESDSDCRSPEGLVFEQSFPLVPGAPTEFTVDFGDVIDRVPRTTTSLVGSGPAAQGPVTRAAPTPPDQQARVRAVLGAPFYVRVLPADSTGPRCNTVVDGVPIWVLLASILEQPPEEPPPDIFTLDQLNRYLPPVRVFDGDRPHLGDYAVRVIQPYYLDPNLAGSCLLGGFWQGPRLDNIACQIAIYVKGVDFGDTLQPGDRFWIHPPSGGGGIPIVSDLIEGFGALITGAIDGLGFLVNKASQLWEDVKAQVVKYTAAAISLTGYECNSTCVAAVEFALETGLATAGIPPSLPNWDQLVDLGTDYLVAQAASELPPIPGKEEALKAAAKKIVDEVKQSIKTNRGPSKHPWLVPDLGVDPAVLLMDLVHIGPPVNAPFTPNLLVSKANELFQVGKAVIPPYAAWPGAPGNLQSLVVPMVLRADTQTLDPGKGPGGIEWPDEWKALILKDLWLQALDSRGCLTLKLAAQSVTAPGPGGSPGLILNEQPLMSLALLPQFERVFSLADNSFCLP